MENTVLRITGTLKSVEDTVRPNSNGTKYRRCTVEIQGANGTLIGLGKIWETNYAKGVYQVGNSYAVDAENVDGQAYLTVCPFSNGLSWDDLESVL